MISDIEEDVADLEQAVSLAHPAKFLAAVSQSAFTYTPSLVAHTYEDLRSTGNLKLIQDNDIKGRLRKYYSYDESQRQFISLNLMIEFRYFELSAGIVIIDQYRLVQDRWFIVTPKNLAELEDVEPDRLPKLRGLQADQIKAHQRAT